MGPELTKLYVSPRKDLPKRRTNPYAMRLPSPVSIKTLAKKKARVIDHGILLARDVDGELL